MIKLFKDRLNILNKFTSPGNVLYISHRDQRLESNHAICYGYYLSYKYKSQFYIVFPVNNIKCNEEQYKFMMEGISEICDNKFNLHIDIIGDIEGKGLCNEKESQSEKNSNDENQKNKNTKSNDGNTKSKKTKNASTKKTKEKNTKNTHESTDFNQHLINIIKEKDIKYVLIDYNPLREYQNMLKDILNICNDNKVQCIEIDSHNVVPHTVLDVYKRTSSSVKMQLYKLFPKYFDLIENDSIVDDTYVSGESGEGESGSESGSSAQSGSEETEDESQTLSSDSKTADENTTTTNTTKDPSAASATTDTTNTSTEDTTTTNDTTSTTTSTNTSTPSTNEEISEKDTFYNSLLENLVPHKYNKNVNNLKIKFEKCKWFKGGHTAGMKVFTDFMKTKFNRYSDLRNDPDEDVLSNLSPYLHFGQLSTYKIIKQVYDNSDKKNLDIFLNEIFVWKETSEHYCYHEPNYDNINGALPWAKQSLLDHTQDKREHLYDYETLKLGKTSDDFWNAAQKELLLTNKIHGYARMYWSKEIVKWTKTPQDAISICIKLNDTYSIDGNDPCGYMGIMWSICGNMDRGYKDRKCCGKIRPMNAPKTHWYSRMWNNEKEVEKELKKRIRIGE